MLWLNAMGSNGEKTLMKREWQAREELKRPTTYCRKRRNSEYHACYIERRPSLYTWWFSSQDGETVFIRRVSSYINIQYFNERVGDERSFCALGSVTIFGFTSEGAHGCSLRVLDNVSRGRWCTVQSYHNRRRNVGLLLDVRIRSSLHAMEAQRWKSWKSLRRQLSQARLWRRYFGTDREYYWSNTYPWSRTYSKRHILTLPYAWETLFSKNNQGSWVKAFFYCKIMVVPMRQLSFRKYLQIWGGSCFITHWLTFNPTLFAQFVESTEIGKWSYHGRKYRTWFLVAPQSKIPN